MSHNCSTSEVHQVDPIIQRFFDQISWANECKVVRIGGKDFVETDIALYLPCDQTDVLSALCLARRVATNSGLQPGIIVDGDLQEATVEQILFTASDLGVYVFFIDPIARLAHSRFVVSALDGVDWQRTIESINQGVNKPVMEWE